MGDSEPIAVHRKTLMRSLVAIAIGVVAGAIVMPFFGIAAGLLAGWGALALTGLIWLLLVVWPMDAAQTRTHALAEDPGRRAARLISFAGSVASLAAVAIVLLQTDTESRPRAFLLAGIALVSVAASWGLIQIDYMLRVAVMYYTDPVGGIDFNQPEPPMYTDFAYFALGLGIAYQVADTNVSSNEVRRLVIGQTLLAYVFGAVILASVVNLVAGLR